jgi:hypothetical protein
VGLLASFVTVVGMAATSATGQPQPKDAFSPLHELAEKMKQSIPSQQQRFLSSSGQMLLNLPDNQQMLQKLRGRPSQQQPGTPRPAPQGYANDPNAPEDFLSRFGGNTQNEPSTAWCGKTAVTGYVDTGSLISSLVNPNPSKSISIVGWSRTTDPDKKQPSYTDMGALVADPPPPGVTRRDIIGDPTLGCSSSSNFYFGTTAAEFPTTGGFRTGVSVARSTDGGQSFQSVMAASADGTSHFFDKPWVAVEPGATASASDDIIHVTYTDFDNSGANCGGVFCTEIEYVKSTDGGVTWTAPQVIDKAVGVATEVFGSLVDVGPGGNVHIAWERFDPDYQTRSIQTRRSVDDGISFGATSVVSSVVPTGNGTIVQGLFRNFVDLQGLKVDPSSNAVYVTWNDGRFAQQPDINSDCQHQQKYCFASALLAKSTDGGATWSAPTRVDNGSVGQKVDRIQPALDVDSHGRLWSLYYDRLGAFEGVERNFRIEAVVAQSSDGGSSWKRKPVSSRFFPTKMDENTPPFYMGDYNWITTDKLNKYPGALASWGDNDLGDANVRTAHVLPDQPKPSPKPDEHHHGHKPPKHEPHKD